MPKLLLFLQDGGAREVLFDKDRITIGRRSDNDVPLPYPAVSGRHAVISYLSPEKCYVEDLKSTNGTLLNGASIYERQQLKDRDQIDIGGQKFVYLEGIKPSDTVKGKDEKKAKLQVVKNEKTIVTDEDATEPPSLTVTKTIPPGLVPSLVPPPLAATPNLTLASSHEHLSARATIPGKSMPLTEQDLEEEEIVSGLHFPTIIKTSSHHPPPKAKEPMPLPTLDSELVPPSADEELPGPTLPQPLEDPTYHLPPPVATLTAVAGPNEQRQLSLRYGEYVLGRPGYQLAVIRVSEEGCRLLPMEGEPPITLREQPITAEGVLLADQDTFTVGRSLLLFELAKTPEETPVEP
ncbi:MAG: FHA domain-containing protein [Betaproteobacteria bacterium]|nr:FHA domain-containing protein [Betaproteobacteria bacterium]